MTSSWRRSAWGSAGALGALALAACSGGDSASCEAVERITEPSGSFHVTEPGAVDYQHHPPAAGAHFGGRPPEPGVHDEPLEYIHQVLALEVGMVVIQYDADQVEADAVDQLEELAEGADDVIVTPAPAEIEDGRAVAFTAWQQRQLCSGVSGDVVDAAEEFIDTAERGPGEGG